MAAYFSGMRWIARVALARRSCRSTRSASVSLALAVAGISADGTSPYFSIRLNAHSHSPPSASPITSCFRPWRNVSPASGSLTRGHPVHAKQRRARLFQQVEKVEIRFGKGRLGADAALLQRRSPHQDERREQPAVARLLLIRHLAEGQDGGVMPVVLAQDPLVERGRLEAVAAQPLQAGAVAIQFGAGARSGPGNPIASEDVDGRSGFSGTGHEIATSAAMIGRNRRHRTTAFARAIASSRLIATG